MPCLRARLYAHFVECGKKFVQVGFRNAAQRFSLFGGIAQKFCHIVVVAVDGVFRQAFLERQISFVLTDYLFNVIYFTHKNSGSETKNY